MTLKIKELRPRFVEFIPERLEDGVLYISERFATASHRCCCGCGEEVVTPLNPAGWRLQRGAGAVSLWPSIGNWSFPCRSHYVVRQNYVLPAGAMTQAQIRSVQARDSRDLTRYVAALNSAKARAGAPEALQPASDPGLLRRLRRWLGM